MISRSTKNKLKNGCIAALILTLIIIFIFLSGCTEEAVSGGETLAKASENSGGISSGAGAIPGIINSIQSDNSGQSYAVIPIVNESKTVQYHYIAYYLLAGDQGYHFTIDINTDGAPVDVLILDEDNFQTYSNAFKVGGSTSFTGVFYRFVIEKNFDYLLPSQGKYYLVIENAPFLVDGADARRDVKVDVNIELIK